MKLEEINNDMKSLIVRMSDGLKKYDTKPLHNDTGPGKNEKCSMIAKEFLSTGEVAEILNISRDTIIRKFDKGIFTGKQNPLTGRRCISRESLEAFMKQYELLPNGLDLEKKVDKDTLEGILFYATKDLTNIAKRVEKVISSIKNL